VKKSRGRGDKVVSVTSAGEQKERRKMKNEEIERRK
jgi:hypothetical protein